MQRDKQESQARFNRRALLMGVAGAAAFAGLGARLYSLQILEQDRYRTCLKTISSTTACSRRRGAGFWTGSTSPSRKIATATG